LMTSSSVTNSIGKFLQIDLKNAPTMSADGSISILKKVQASYWLTHSLSIALFAFL